MPTNGQEVEMQQVANQEQLAQKNDTKDEQPKAEEKKKRPMGMPNAGGGGLRLEHEYQVLFGDNGGGGQESGAREDSKANQQAAQGGGNIASDMKIQLLEKEVALLKEQMANVQAELQQLKAEQALANEPALTHELLNKLRELNGGKDVSPKVKENLNKILTDAKDSEEVLQQAMNEREPGDPIYAGHYVPNIVAGKQITDIIKNADTPDVLTLLSEDGFPARWQEQMKLSPDVRFASDYFHDKEFFRQELFTEEGSQQIIKSVDNSLGKLADAINAGKENPYETLNLASKIEAEELAIEAGLVSRLEQVPQPTQDKQSEIALPQEQMLLEHMRALNGDKEVPEQVKNNLHQLLAESAKSRDTLRQALDSRESGEMLYAGDLVPSIVAGKNMEDFIMDSTTPDILDVIGNKDFLSQWKNMSRLSTDVRFASDYMHDKEFFEQSIFTENGMRQLSRSMDQGLEKWDEYIQAGKDTEMLYKASEIEAEKLAIEAGLERSPASLSQEQKLLEHLREINGNKEVPEQVKNNLSQLLDESAQSRGMLRQALNSRKPGEMLYAGDLVPSIVAGKNMENFIMDSTTPEILDVIGNKDFVSQWKNMSRLSADVRFASDYMHDKEFFEQSIFTKNGMRQLSRSMDQGLEKWDKHIQAGKDPEMLYKASEIGAEKLAIEAGLVSKPEQVSKSGQTQQSAQKQQPKPKAQNEEELLQFMQKENKGKELPQAVKDNIHQVLADGEKSREILKNGVKAMKDGERVWAGDGTIESVVAADVLKQMIQNRGEPFATYLGGYDNFINLLGGKDFPKGWKNLTGISENVRYAANFEHNKDFFEKNVLEPEGLQRLTQSISDKFPVYLQKAATKQDSELYKEAQKGAFQRDYIANQQKKDKPKQEKQKKQQKQQEKSAAKENVQSNAPSIG